MSTKSSNEPVQFRKAGAIAVITIDNPPVNALAKHVRMAIADYLETAADDHLTHAVVISGNGRNLCGGADIHV